MNLVFLDVDGVLNNDTTTQVAPNGKKGMDPVLLTRLGRVVQITGCQIVVSSSWRLGFGPEGTFFTELRKTSVGRFLADQVIGRTPDMFTSFNRALSTRDDEIQDWLYDNPGVERFVILDDLYEDMGPLTPHLIHVDSEIGLSNANCADMLRRFGVPC